MLDGEWVPDIQLADIGRLMLSVILPPLEGFDPHNSGPEAITIYTNLYVCTSSCLQTSAARVAALLPADIYANYRNGLAASAELGPDLAPTAQTVSSIYRTGTVIGPK